MEITKEYSNGELTIVWKPKLCIHSGICVQSLPKVYHPKDSPWITIENATTKEIENQIKKCPSGALSYYFNENKTEENITKSVNTQINITKNGPLLIKGNFDVTDSENNAIECNDTIALCRCGASKNKPFCDGSHKRIGFNDSK